MQVHVCKHHVGARRQPWVSSAPAHLVLRNRISHGDLRLASQQPHGPASSSLPSERMIGTRYHVQLLVGFVDWTQVLVFVRQTLYLLNYFPCSRILLYSFFYPKNSPNDFCKTSCWLFFLEWLPTASLCAVEQKDGSAGSEASIPHIRTKSRASFLRFSLL